MQNLNRVKDGLLLDKDIFKQLKVYTLSHFYNKEWKENNIFQVNLEAKIKMKSLGWWKIILSYNDIISMSIFISISWHINEKVKIKEIFVQF